MERTRFFPLNDRGLKKKVERCGGMLADHALRSET